MGASIRSIQNLAVQGTGFQNQVGIVIRCLIEWQREFIAQPRVEREPRADLPVVLDVALNDVLPALTVGPGETEALLV